MTPRAADGLAAAHLATLVSRGEVPSLAWAVVRDEDTAAGGFGGAGPATIFQVGSVTKVFTALLLADMAERGEVHLSDPAASYLPGPAPLGSAPRASGQPGWRPGTKAHGSMPEAQEHQECGPAARDAMSRAR